MAKPRASGAVAFILRKPDRTVNYKNNYGRLFLSDREGHQWLEESGGSLPDLSDPDMHRGEIIRDHDFTYLYGEG